MYTIAHSASSTSRIVFSHALCIVRLQDQADSYESREDINMQPLNYIYGESVSYSGANKKLSWGLTLVNSLECFHILLF